MPLPSNPLRAPPATVISSTAKFVEASERVKLMLAVSPMPRESTLEVIVTVGAVTSVFTDIVIDPAALAFPAASVNLPASMLTTPSAMLLSAGVNVAVYVVPVPLKLLRVPPLTVTSSSVKSAESSERVKVMVALSLAASASSLVVIATVGAVVSGTTVFTVMLTDASPVLALSAASLKAPAATETTPVVVLSGVGVNMAA